MKPNLLSPKFHIPDVRVVEAYFEIVNIGWFKFINWVKPLWNQNNFIFWSLLCDKWMLELKQSGHRTKAAGGGVYIMTLTYSISSILFLSFRIFLVKTSPWPVSIVHTNLTKYQFIIAFSND